MRLLIADDDDYTREGLKESIDGRNTALTIFCLPSTEQRRFE